MVDGPGSVRAGRPRWSRRRVLGTLSSGVGVAVLAACGGNASATTSVGKIATVSSGATTNATPATSASTAVGSRKPATATTASVVAASAATPAANAIGGQVDFWQVYANSAALPKISAMIQQKYPHLQVNLLQFASNADVATKLVAAVAGGTPPGGVYETAPFFRDIQPFLVPLDPYISRDSKAIAVDDFLPIGFKASTVDGKVYGLPMEIAVRGWWFNRQKLLEQGVALPVGATAPAHMTEQQLEDSAQKLTTGSGTKQTYGLYVDRTWYSNLIFVYGYGGRFLDDAQATCLLDSQEAIAGLQHASDLVVQRKLGPATGGIVPHATTNDIAMILGNAALAQNLRPMSNGTDWDTGPVVMGPAAPMSFAFVHCGGIVKGAKNPENSWIAASEYTGKDAEPFWMEANGWPTVRQSYLDLWIKNGSPPPTTRQNVLEWAKQAELVTFPSGYSGSIEPVLTKAFQAAIDGKSTVRDAATQAAQQVTALLKKPG